MDNFVEVTRGLGQLEAYIDRQEGVAFQMDDGMYWDSVVINHRPSIEGTLEKKWTTKFYASYVHPAMVILRDTRGLYLALAEVVREPQPTPIQLVFYAQGTPLDETVYFEVLYIGNKVAFRALNSLFLARTQFNTIEAAKLHPDDTCYFWPEIGDTDPPTIQIVSVMPYDFTRIICPFYTLKMLSYTNRRDITIVHTFVMTFRARCIFETIWDTLWGFGQPLSFSFSLLGMRFPVVYTKDNKKTVVVKRHIRKILSDEVIMPPGSTAKAYLCVNKQDEASLPFYALIVKATPRGAISTHSVSGTWRGPIYFSLRIKTFLRIF